MPLNRQQNEFAKRLARLSLDEGGQIDPARVNTVLACVRSKKPRLLRPLLKAYLRHLQIEDRRGRLLYEYAGVVDAAKLESLRTRFGQKYKRTLRLELKENPSLIAGVRVSIGDDIFEFSAAGRLASLASALA